GCHRRPPLCGKIPQHGIDPGQCNDVIEICEFQLLHELCGSGDLGHREQICKRVLGSSTVGDPQDLLGVERPLLCERGPCADYCWGGVNQCAVDVEQDRVCLKLHAPHGIRGRDDHSSSGSAAS